MQEKIRELSSTRIKYLIEKEIPFYEGHETYIRGVKEELQEAIDEIKDNNSVHLEDELGDVFWTYLCLLHSLEDEGKISSVEKVFDRCYKKFGERIGYDGQGGKNWDEVKKKQKKELKLEHNKLYNENS